MRRRPTGLLLVLALVVAASFVITQKVAGSSTATGVSPVVPGSASPDAAPSTTGSAGGSGSVTSPPAPQHSSFTITKLKPGEKPPQFVITAFDGSGDVSQLKDWARITKQVNGNVTYFLSGVFLLYTANRMHYHGPHEPPGYSSINFRQDYQEPIPELTALLSQAWLDGNDIGTHFNGHFCGASGVGTWSQANWVDELTQWNGLVDNWQANNAITGAPPLSFDHTVSVGGRTPCLEGKPAAYLAAMKQLGYRYDTSATGLLRWPSKTPQGLWEFPLPTVKWMGARGGSNLVMDYNLWYAYNKNQPITSDAERAVVAKNVYDTYQAAFAATYNGNRAPLFFGNHMNYWGCNQAFKDCQHTATGTGDTPLQHYGPFTSGLQQAYITICTKPDVQCVSYRQLADWLDAQDPAVVAQLQGLGAVTG
jgi:hypothetical protein